MSNYNAPALAKGLDIIEFLAASGAFTSVADLARQLGRTVPELYRMVLVLSERGYVEAQGRNYAGTSKLFTLALRHPDVQSLLTVAAPEMERLSRTTGQACYLSVADSGSVVTIAAQSSLNELGLNVRVGARHSLLETAAGYIHFAFAPMVRRVKWQEALAENEDADKLAFFLEAAERASFTGQAERAHPHMNLITEIARPVIMPSGRVFALSLLYLRQADTVNLMICNSELSQSAIRIARNLRNKCDLLNPKTAFSGG